jgi:hypothetical protein
MDLGFFPKIGISLEFPACSVPEPIAALPSIKSHTPKSRRSRRKYLQNDGVVDYPLTAAACFPWFLATSESQILNRPLKKQAKRCVLTGVFRTASQKSKG